MRFNVKATAVTVALVWGFLGMFLTGLANMILPGYGQAFLDVIASIYPGYQATPGLGQVLVGSLYGAVDGAIVGTVFAWLYNACAARFGG